MSIMLQADVDEDTDASPRGEMSRPLKVFGNFVDRLCRPPNPQAATLMRDVSPLDGFTMTPEEERDLALVAVQAGESG
jgi:hypothetical protein